MQNTDNPAQNEQGWAYPALMAQARRRATGRARPATAAASERDRAVQPLLELQRTAGNRATTGFVLQRAAQSKAGAIAAVAKHVEPKSCFVWFADSKRGWTPIPGTGCAHWIAHQLGLGTGTVSCDAGQMTRVRDVTKGRKPIALAEARPGDLWQSTEVASHAGIVRQAALDGSVVVEHDSVRRGGVVTETMTKGRFFEA